MDEYHGGRLTQADRQLLLSHRLTISCTIVIRAETENQGESSCLHRVLPLFCIINDSGCRGSVLAARMSPVHLRIREGRRLRDALAAHDSLRGRLRHTVRRPDSSGRLTSTILEWTCHVKCIPTMHTRK